jgi:hypothetical protein
VAEQSYLVAHLSELLATHPGVAQPGLEVVAEPHRFVLRGTVASRAQRDEAVRLVVEHAEGCTVDCLIDVLEDEPVVVDTPERLS